MRNGARVEREYVESEPESQLKTKIKSLQLLENYFFFIMSEELFCSSSGFLASILVFVADLLTIPKHALPSSISYEKFTYISEKIRKNWGQKKFGEAWA